jgi:hypothetical protein
VTKSAEYEARLLRYERDKDVRETIAKCQHLVCPNSCPKRFAQLEWSASFALEHGGGMVNATATGDVVRMVLGLRSANAGGRGGGRGAEVLR